MTFPTTGILDDFNRANEGPPPSASWITGPNTESSSNGLVVDSNQVKATNLTYGGTASWGVTFGPDIEVYITESNAGGVFILYWRISDPTDTVMMYGYRFSGYNWGGNRTYTVDSLNGLPISTVTLWTATLSGTIANGDQVGISHIGDQISVYENLGGGGWSLVNTITDNTYSSAGYIGMGLGSTTGRLDNFGGGTVVTPGPAWIVNCRNLAASGTGAVGLRITNTAYALDVHPAATTDVTIDASATLNAYGLQYDTSSISGTLNALAGDRSVFDALGYQARHANDIDAAAGIHHSASYLGSIFIEDTLANGSIFIGGADGAAHAQSVHGDGSLINDGTFTLSDVNANVGTYGDRTHLAQITVDAKGRITAIGEIAFDSWEDLRLEPVARTTGANAPTFEKWYDDLAGTSRGVYLYSFDDAAGGSEKEIFFSMQMPHSWKAGTDIHLHVHWVGNVDDTTATPRWGLEYVWKSLSEVFGDTTIIYAVGNTISDANITANKHYITEFAPITPGTTADDASSILIGRVFRDSANGADTYNAATNKCGLLYIDAHYIVSSFGSENEYS